jgi:hypothetical protein
LAYCAGGVQGNDRRIVFSDREGNLTPWSDHRQHFNIVLVSPDAKYIAMQVDNTGEGDDLLQIRSSEIDPPRLLTVGAHPGTDCGTLAWSTDSQLIAYGCSGQDKAVIYVTGPAEAGSSRLLLEYPEKLGGSVRGFTADSSHVLVGRFGPEGKRELISVAVDGDDPSSNFERVTMDDEPSGWPLPTHDGRWMLYFSRDTGRRELYIREIIDDHSVGPRSSLGLEADLAWWSHVHGNGTYELFFFSDTRLYAVDVQMRPTLRVGTPRLIDIDTGKAGLGYTDSLPDGRLIHMQQPDSEYGASEIRLILNWREELEKRF